MDKTGFDIDRLRDAVRSRMDDRRYAHTLGVEAMAVRLGELYLPYKTEELRCAALLHDITKQETLEKQLQYIVEFDIMIRDFGELTPALLHSMTGAAVISKDFPEYATEDIVSAVRWHTTGRRDMTLFDSLIYLADYIEDGRDFDDCVLLRKYFWEAFPEKMNESERLAHLWRTMVKSVDFTVRQLTSSGRYIDVNAIECRNYYLEKINKKQTL